MGIIPIRTSYSFALGMAVELFFIFNCHGFKPVAIENKKSGNVQPDHAGTIVEAWECPKNYPLIFFKAALIPRTSEELNPWVSISLNPAIVQPCGVVTLSINCSGCAFSSKIISAAPFTV